MTCIVKVQRPLFTFSKVEEVLIYNADRSVEVFVDMTEDLLERMDDSFKEYFYYTIEDGILILGKKVPPSKQPKW